MLNLDKLYIEFEKKLPSTCTLSTLEKKKLFDYFCAINKAYFDSLKKVEESIESDK